MKAKCPGCGSWVNLEEDLDLGDQVECPNCEEILKVIRRNPPKLDYYFGDDDAEDQDEDKDEEW